MASSPSCSPSWCSSSSSRLKRAFARCSPYCRCWPPTCSPLPRAAHGMTTSRLTSFTDGVIAIIITIMVLELPVPKAPGMTALVPLSVLFAAYALSFVKVGIYWSQHHNMLHAARKVSGPVLLANLFFRYWLSLIPFVVRWVGEAGITRDTVLAYGIIMLLCTISFGLLLAALLEANEEV